MTTRLMKQTFVQQMLCVCVCVVGGGGGGGGWGGAHVCCDYKATAGVQLQHKRQHK